jgi:hypothetical protein
MKPEDILNHPVCLLIMGADREGKDDWTVHRGEIVVLDGVPHFSSSAIPRPFPLPDDTFSRIKPVTELTRDTLLACDFVLPLSCGNITNEEAKSMVATGLRYPDA